MSAARLALLGGFVAAALLAAFWLQRDDGESHAQRAAIEADVAPTPAVVESPNAAATMQAAAPAPALAAPTGRATEAELRVRAAEESYARFGEVFVDHLVARGLARGDGELVVRRFFDDNQQCLFDALRAEADAQAVVYDMVLDAVETDLYDTDGPLIGAVLDMRAVEARVTPCALTAAQQAGIDASALSGALRAEILRRAQR
jgi:hypothetical protein